MRRVVTVCADPPALARTAARRFADACSDAVAKRGRATVCLSGGRTPRETYALLSRAPWRTEIHWRSVHIFWGDERCVPVEQTDNHFRMATELFLAKVGMPPENVHRVRGEAPDPSEAAAEYEEHLRREFSLHRDELPRFDLVLLGMGADGHTASIFPGTVACDEQERLVVSHYVPKLQTHRLTLTLPVLNRARQVLFLVSGAEKADALAGVLGGEMRLPAGRVQPEDGVVRWIVDEAAATSVPSSVLGSRELRVR